MAKMESATPDDGECKACLVAPSLKSNFREYKMCTVEGYDMLRLNKDDEDDECVRLRSGTFTSTASSTPPFGSGSP
jgi:hypothetical protein